MSIQEIIDDLVQEGNRLFPLHSQVEGSPCRRRIYMSAELAPLLNGPWCDDDAARRLNMLRADLDSFVEGGITRVCLTPFKAKTADFGLLNPPNDGIWDFRSRNPKPGLRVVGAFAEPDIFIALFCASRSKTVPYLHRPPLGSRDSREWRDAIEEAKAQWRRLFFTYPPFIGEKANDYITESVLLVGN